MKPQARIQAIIELLERVYASPVPMDATSGDYMRTRRYIGSKDRAFIVEHVYGMMRHHARLGWWAGHLTQQDTARTRTILYFALVQGDALSRFKDLYDGSSHAPERLSEDELDLIGKIAGQDINHRDMPEAAACECPPDYAQSLQSYFGAAFKDELLAMMMPATLDLRVNTFLIDVNGAAGSLAKDGVETEQTPFSHSGLRCSSKAYLSKTKAFHKGWVSIQDEGSQMIAQICEAKPGMQVLDFCAGGGGKTLALASAMQRKGRIVAMDNDSRRLEKGKQRYKKAQLADIIEVRSLEDEKNRKWLRRQKEKFDVVLTDVPCSGTGTWRRNPDMRWRHYGPSLADILPVQSEILQRASEAVKVGGKLVYATCSLLPEENEGQVEQFLAANPDFALSPLDEAQGLGTPYMRLTPLRHKTDGFFAAVMVRKA